VAGFVDVLLRGLALCGQAVAVGGVFFGLVLLRPALAARPTLAGLLARSLATTAAGAAAAACAQVLSLGVQVVALAGDGGWPLREILATTYFRAAAGRILAGALVLVGCTVVRRRAVGWGWLLQLVGVAGLTLAAAWTSHAAARLGPRAFLLTLDALHQLAAGVWIGGLAQLLVLAWGRSAPPWPAGLLKRFSATALAAVAVLVAAGAGLAFAYVDGVGVGAGVVDRLQQLNYSVVEINGGAKAYDEVKYFNATSEQWDRMRDWIKTADMPSDTALRHALIGREFYFDDKERIRMERKSDMKRRGLPSPDEADALAHSFAEILGDISRNSFDPTDSHNSLDPE